MNTAISKGSVSGALLEAEGGDGVEARRLAGGVVAEEDADQLAMAPSRTAMMRADASAIARRVGLGFHRFEIDGGAACCARARLTALAGACEDTGQHGLAFETYLKAESVRPGAAPAALAEWTEAYERRTGGIPPQRCPRLAWLPVARSGSRSDPRGGFRRC